MKLPRTIFEFKEYCRKVIAYAASASIVLTPAMSSSLPQGGIVSAGQATIADGVGRVDIHQTTDKAVIDWRGFDLQEGEATQFHQPGNNSLTVNRVNSNSPSIINGSLKANGNVMVINPNGMLFGGKANVDVNGLIASTADGDNASLMKDGKLALSKPGNPNAAIVNQGRIKTKDGGRVGIIAPNISNQGIIEARLGKVQLASGDTATVDLFGDGLIEAAVSDKVKSQLIENNGIISAGGGSIAITAAAGDQIVDSLINLGGVLDARSVGTKTGNITVRADGSNAVKGNKTPDKGKKSGSSNVLVSGILDASGRNAGERGGFIQVLGDNIALLADSFIDASGHTGLIGTADGKPISSVREGSAGGDIRIGGDYLGLGETPTANNLYVDPNAFILNDSIHSGDAGRTIFWSDGTTQFYGNVFARALGGMGIDPITGSAIAGGNPGDGGFVETSGHEHLDAGGYVDLTASNGNRGTYFLDPTNVTIYGNVTSVYDSGNLAGHWGFDEGSGSTAFDSTLNGNNGGIVGTSTYSSNVAPTPNANANSLSFDGSTNYVDLGTSATLNPGNLTVSGWVYLNNTGTIMSLWDNSRDCCGAYNGVEILYNYPGLPGRSTYTIWNGSMANLNSVAAIGTGSWHHSVYTYDATTLKIYLDGVLDNSLANGQGIGSPASFNNYIGRRGSGPGFLWNGLIDEVRLFNSAISDNDVAELYGSRFTVAGIEKMSQTANVSIQATNNITLDMGGDTIDMTNNRNLTLTAGNQITTASAGTITTTGTGTINFNAADYNQLHALTLNGAGGTTITADTINIGANIGGTGTLTLQQATANRTININTGTGAFDLSNAEIANLSDGWSRINIGSATGTNNVFVNYSGNWLDPVTFRSGNLVQFFQGNASGNGSFTASGGGVLYLSPLTTAGGAVDFSATASVLGLNAGLKTVTTNGGSVTLSKINTSNLADSITVNSGGGTIDLIGGIDVLSGSAAGQTITLNAGAGAISFGGIANTDSGVNASAGSMTFAGAWGGTTPLGNVSLTSTNALSLPSINAATIFARTTGATSDITIPVGKTLTASGAGNAITLAAGRNFLNTAGPAALSTPAGRWLIYSTDPSVNVPNGLVSDFSRYGCTYGGTCPAFPATGNGVLFSVASLGGAGAGGGGGGGTSIPFSEPVIEGIPIVPEVATPATPTTTETPTNVVAITPPNSPIPVVQFADSGLPLTVQRISIDPTPILVDAGGRATAISNSNTARGNEVVQNEDSSSTAQETRANADNDPQNEQSADNRILSMWDGMLTITPELARRLDLDPQHWQ